MVLADMRGKVSDFLFSFTNCQLYSIIDGASVSGLLGAIDVNGPRHCCLLSGKLDQALAQAAPYLIKLEKKSPLTDWLLDGWGKHFGVYCIIEEHIPFAEVRKHFRSLLTVKTPDDKSVFFRFYDPRVLGIYLPTCTTSEAQQVFGPVKLYVFEGSESEEDTVRHYWPGSNGVEYKASSYTA